MQNLKYDPDAWLDFAANKAVPCPAQLHLRLSEPGTVHVDLGGGYRLLGYGSELKVTLPSSGKVKCDVPYAIHVGVDTAVKQTGAPFTNFDKRPGESAIERMVRKSQREFEVEQALKREARRRLDREMNARRVAQGLQDRNPIPDEPEEPEKVPVGSDGNPVETPPAAVPPPAAE